LNKLDSFHVKIKNKKKNIEKQVVKNSITDHNHRSNNKIFFCKFYHSISVLPICGIFFSYDFLKYYKNKKKLLTNKGRLLFLLSD
jgi:hypothetical protein